MVSYFPFLLNCNYVGTNSVKQSRGCNASSRCYWTCLWHIGHLFHCPEFESSKVEGRPLYQGQKAENAGAFAHYHCVRDPWNASSSCISLHPYKLCNARRRIQAILSTRSYNPCQVSLADYALRDIKIVKFSAQGHRMRLAPVSQSFFEVSLLSNALLNYPPYCSKFQSKNKLEVNNKIVMHCQ